MLGRNENKTVKPMMALAGCKCKRAVRCAFETYYRYETNSTIPLTCKSKVAPISVQMTFDVLDLLLVPWRARCAVRTIGQVVIWSVGLLSNDASRYGHVEMVLKGLQYSLFNSHH